MRIKEVGIFVAVGLGWVAAHGQGLPNIMLKVPGHAGTPDGWYRAGTGQIVTEDRSGCTKVWAAGTGDHLYTCSVPNNSWGGADVSPSGDVITKTSYAAVVALSLNDFQTVATGYTSSPVLQPAFSPEGSLIAVTGASKCFLFDRDLHLLRSGGPGSPESVRPSWSSDAKVLAVPSLSGGAVILRVSDLSQLGLVNDALPTDLAMSPDGRLLAVSVSRATGPEIHVWDWAAQTLVANLKPSSGLTAGGLAWAPTRGFLLSCTSKALDLWRISDWTLVGSAPFSGGPKSRPRFAPDGGTVLVGDVLGSLTEFAVPSLRPNLALGERVGTPNGATLSPDGLSLGTDVVEQDLSVYGSVFDVKTGKTRWSVAEGASDPGIGATNLAWIDKDRVAVVVNGGLDVRSALTGQVLDRFPLPGFAKRQPLRPTSLGYDPVTHRLYLVTGSTLLALDTVLRVPVWTRPATGRQLLNARVGLVAEAGRPDGLVLVYSALDGHVVKSFQFAQACPCIAFAHDGSRFALGLTNGAVRVYSTADWALLGELHAGSIPLQVAFSPSGHRIAVSTSGPQFNIYNGMTLGLVAAYDKETMYGSSLCYIDDATIALGRVDSFLLYIASP